MPYHLASHPFLVRPWSGITVDDLRLESDRTVSFRNGPRHTYTVGGPSSQVQVFGSGPELQAEIGPIDYPDSYARPRRSFGTFRPWLDAGDAAEAQVTVIQSDGSREKLTATEENGRWATQRCQGRLRELQRRPR